MCSDNNKILWIRKIYLYIIAIKLLLVEYDGL